MYTAPVVRFHGSERAWTAHLATNVGMTALLRAASRAPLPDHVASALDEVLHRLAGQTTVDALGLPEAYPTDSATHQLHLDGRYPDVVVHDARDRVFAVVEAQRRGADDKHIAKLAAHYVPASGAQLGILVAEGWRASSARHPAWAACPAPVVVLVALDALHELDYQVAWVSYPADGDWP